MTDPSTVCGVSLVGLPADTLGRVAEFGPYFAVSTGPVAEPGWRPVRALYTDPVALAGLVGRVRARLDVGDGRVAASIMVQGHAARLWSLSLGTGEFHTFVVDGPGFPTGLDVVVGEVTERDGFVFADVLPA